MIQLTSFKYRLSRFFCKSIIQTFEKISKKYGNVDLPLFDIDLKKNFEFIKKEFLDYYASNIIPAAGDISAEQLRIEDKSKWRTLVLRVFGYNNEDNCNHCPVTSSIIKKYNNITSALFSVMEPGAHIKPHRGVFNGVLRYHLGIIIPNSDNVFININNIKTYWKENNSFVFDDTFLHEAINNTSEYRVVLIIDFIRPLPYLLNIANNIIIKIISKSPLIQNIIENLENVKTKQIKV